MKIWIILLFLGNSKDIFAAPKKIIRNTQLMVYHLDFDDQKKVSESYIAVTKKMQEVNQNELVLPMIKGFNFQINYRVENKKLFLPQYILNKICGEFKLTLSTNTFMLVNDEGATNAAEFHRQANYFIHTISSLGIPTITWFPDKSGRYELDRAAYAIRLEPLNWHIVRAIVNFMQAYNWTRITTLVSEKVPDYQSFVKELIKVQKEKELIAHENSFRFTITQRLYLSGLTPDDIMDCNNKRQFCPFVLSTLRALDRIYRNDDRIILFHGTVLEMMNVLKAVRDNANGPKRYLKKLFGSNYLWLCTPTLTSPIASVDRFLSIAPDLNVIKGELKFNKVDYSIPGMFVFVVFNNVDAYEAKAKIARELWVKSINELTDFLRNNHLNNDTAIVEKLRPVNLCEKMNSKWVWGQKLYQIMKNITLEINGEYIGFRNNGIINTTEMYIYNSKIKNNIMGWHKVGSWSMSSKWGKEKEKLIIDGVTWPGNEIKPPKDRPEKFRLKIVTIVEVPFVIYRESETGKCDANSIKCWIRDKSGRSDKKTDSDTNFKLFGINVSSDFPYINGCCSGLTMDMLSEFMKDLDFDVVLFDVPDGMWGGWTPDGWNGLVKILLNNTADMAVTSFKITPNRSEQVDFSVPFQETGIAIIVALREGGISPKAFLEPYDYQSWCVILVFSVHACGAALFIYEWLSPNGLDRGNQVVTEHKFSFFRSLWLIWSMLFGAAVNADNPRGTASRFLANIWALFALVFLASYTANLAAFMIAKDDYYDLRGIKDELLMKPMQFKPPFSFATVPSGATEENIKINFPSMFEYMRKFNKSTIDEGIKALKAGDINAFLYDSNVLEYRATKDENCKLRTVGNLFAMTGYGVAFPKESKWLNKINTKILEYQNNGKLQRWKRFWLTGACKKDRRLDSTNKRLGVRNFISAFILLLGGVILCSLILLLEHLFYRYLRPHLKNIDRYGCCGLVSISLGQILSFEESVNRTVDLVKNHKCSNPICETRWWKSRYEINHLKDRIKRLENALLSERSENQKKNHYSRNTESVSNRDKINENQSKPLRLSKNKIGTEIFPSSEPRTDNTPTYVYECSHAKEVISPKDKFQLTCLNPSQIYMPNPHIYSEKSLLLDNDSAAPKKLSTVNSELLEKESCL